MEISITELTDKQKLDVADLQQKVQAIEAEIARVDNERVQTISTYANRLHLLNQEKAKIVGLIQSMRTPTVTE